MELTPRTKCFTLEFKSPTYLSKEVEETRGIRSTLASQLGSYLIDRYSAAHQIGAVAGDSSISLKRVGIFILLPFHISFPSHFDFTPVVFVFVSCRS